jgi:hypothetical protein
MVPVRYAGANLASRPILTFARLHSYRFDFAAIHLKHRGGHPPRRGRHGERRNVCCVLGFTEAADAGCFRYGCLASSSLMSLEAAAFSRMAKRRPVMIAPGEKL